MKVWKIILVAMIGTVPLWMLGDLVTRQLVADQPSFVVEATIGGPGDTAVVYLPGVQADGEINSRPLRPAWRRYGDVVAVRYPRQRFKPDVVVRQTHAMLAEKQYRRVVLIGASMGGILAVDFVDYNKRQERRLQVVGLILADPPMDNGDLVQGDKAPLAEYRAGSLTNIWTKPFWAINGDTYTGSEPGANQDWIAESNAAAVWPLSGYLDQVHYIAEHRALAEGSYTDVRLVLLHAAGDSKVLKDTWVAKWQAAFGPATSLIGVASEHAAFLQYPTAWGAAFEWAFAKLG